MLVLVVDAYPDDDEDGRLITSLIDTLQAKGHTVDHYRVAVEMGHVFMTETEHRAYETDEPLQSDATRDAARRVLACDAMVFGYPTTLFGVSPLLKSWLERVMVMGVAFRLDERRRIRPNLANVRRLGALTTTPHGRLATWRARDLGQRTLMRTLRLNCHPLCRRTYLRLESGRAEPEQVGRRFAAW